MLKNKNAKAELTYQIDWNHHCENTAGAGRKLHEVISHLPYGSGPLARHGFLAQPDAHSQKLAGHDRKLRSCFPSTQQAWIQGFTEPSAGTICDCPTTSNFCRKRALESQEWKDSHTVSAIRAAPAQKIIAYPLQLPAWLWTPHVHINSCNSPFLGSLPLPANISSNGWATWKQLHYLGA